MKEKEIAVIANSIVAAFISAVAAGRQFNSERREYFLRSLGEVLRKQYCKVYANGGHVGVAAEGLRNNIPGLSAAQGFMFDLHMFGYHTLCEPFTKEPLCNVVNSIVQLEADFGRDSLASVLTELNKLVAGKAELKIFVMAKQEDEAVMSVWKEFCMGAALNMQAPFMLFVLPHPSKWDPTDHGLVDSIEIYTLRAKADSYGLIPYMLPKV